MAAKTKKAVKEADEKKSPGLFSKFILLWVLPIVYAIGLGMVILHFAGVGFDKQIKWVQNHTKIFFAKNETNVKTASAHTAQTSASKIKTGVASGNTSETQSNQTATDTSSQTNQNASSQTSSPVSAGSTTNTSGTDSTAANSFASMDPTTAAKLLSNMTEADALKNLKQLSPDQQTAIISEMSPDEGASLTEALSNGNEPATTTSSVSQLYQHMQPEQIAAILNGIKNNQEVLNQIKQLDPNTASKVITQLNPTVAGWIITHLNP